MTTKLVLHSLSRWSDKNSQNCKNKHSDSNSLHHTSIYAVVSSDTVNRQTVFSPNSQLGFTLVEIHCFNFLNGKSVIIFQLTFETPIVLNNNKLHTYLWNIKQILLVSRGWPLFYQHHCTSFVNLTMKNCSKK